MPRVTSTTDSEVRSTGPRVSTLELFFDLVFVFTITQVTGVIDHDPGLPALGQAGLILVLLFWMYAGFTWLTNATGTATNGPRIAVLIGMAALLVCSMAVPEAFGESGLVFGVAYLVLTLTHAIAFRLFGDPAGRRGILRIAPVNLLGAVLILVAGWLHGSWDWLLWGLVAAGYLIALLYFERSRDFSLEAGHFAERHGLMIIIALGESVVSVAVAATGRQLDLQLILGALCGFAAVAGLWWVYFVGDDEQATAAALAGAGQAASADRGSPPPRVVRRAGHGYDLTHLVMIAGIIGVAAGTRLGLEDLFAQAPHGGGALIAGGTALYLLGTAWLRTVFRLARVWPRVAGAVAALVAWPIGTLWGTAQALAAVAVVLAVTAVVGARHPARGAATGPGATMSR